MLGVNGFYDTTKLGSRWYGSGGIGFEMAALCAGNDLVELTFNCYGNLFQGRNSIINAFGEGPSNFDVSARYSIELGNYGPDLRLKATGYQFDIGARRYGYNTEAEVRTRNGMFSVKAGTGYDPVNGRYHTVGCFVNVGLDFANLLNGESPIEMPEPIFRSPRNIRRLLTQKVDRGYVSPRAISGGPLCSTLCDNITGQHVGTFVVPAGQTIGPSWQCFEVQGTDIITGNYNAYITRHGGGSGNLSITFLKSSSPCDNSGKLANIGITSADGQSLCPVPYPAQFLTGRIRAIALHAYGVGADPTADAGCIVITITTR